jgi:hypothetical protein
MKTWILYLLSVATCSKENKREERKKDFQAQALLCLMSIVLSFIFALCHLLLDIIELN